MFLVKSAHQTAIFCPVYVVPPLEILQHCAIFVVDRLMRISGLFGCRLYHIDTTEKNGGAVGNRTPDLYNAIVALSQLSYGPKLKVKEFCVIVLIFISIIINHTYHFTYIFIISTDIRSIFHNCNVLYFIIFGI